MTNEACIRYLEDIVKVFERGKENCVEGALEYQQKYIDALQYAIQKVKKDEQEHSITPASYSDPDDIPDEEFEYYEDEDVKKILERRKKNE